MRLLLLPLLALVACSDASEPASSVTTDATPETPASPEASGEADAGSDAAGAEALSAQTPTPERSAADLTTATELLAAIQAAASGGRAAAFEPFLSLSSEEREMFDDYIAATLVRGGDSHGLLMEATGADLTTDDQTTYTLSLYSETEAEGEIYESSLLLGMAPVDGKYRIVSVLIAG